MHLTPVNTYFGSCPYLPTHLRLVALYWRGDSRCPRPLYGAGMPVAVAKTRKPIRTHVEIVDGGQLLGQYVDTFDVVEINRVDWDAMRLHLPEVQL